MAATKLPLKSAFFGRHHFKSGNHVPVAALGIVVELSDPIPRRQALDTPLFGCDAAVAGYDKRLGVRGHCTEVRRADILPQSVRRMVDRELADKEPTSELPGFPRPNHPRG